MLLESESQRLRGERLRIEGCYRGNLLLILLVHKLCMNTGFCTKTNPRKSKSNVSKHKNQRPEKCKKGAKSKLKREQRWIHKEKIGDNSQNGKMQETRVKNLVNPPPDSPPHPALSYQISSVQECSLLKKARHLMPQLVLSSSDLG